MQQLWAPWRMDLIQQPKPAGCIFCVLPREGKDEENLILGRTQHAFAILNRFPYNNGHLMVVPWRHTADFSSLQGAESEDLHRLLRICVGVLGEAYHPDGFNLGMNLGAVAGAGIADHLHYHAVPRWGGDTNFMPVLGGTKVMIELLVESQRRLRPLIEAALSR